MIGGGGGFSFFLFLKLLERVRELVEDAPNGVVAAREGDLARLEGLPDVLVLLDGLLLRVLLQHQLVAVVDELEVALHQLGLALPQRLRLALGVHVRQLLQLVADALLGGKSKGRGLQFQQNSQRRRMEDE